MLSSAKTSLVCSVVLAVGSACGPVVDFGARTTNLATDPDPSGDEAGGDEDPADIDSSNGDVTTTDEVSQSDSDGQGDQDGDAGSPTDTDPIVYFVSDVFDRTITSGLGTPTSGPPAYTCLASGPADYRVDGGVARLSVTNLSGERDVACQLIDATPANIEVEAIFTGVNGGATLFGRLSADYTRYHLTIGMGAGPDTATIARNVNTTYTPLDSIVLPLEGAAYNVRLRIEGPTNNTTLSATVWPVGSAEPAAPTLVVTDTSALAGRGVGFGAWVSNGTFDMTIDNFRAREW